MQRGTTCRCAACASIGSLDLKFVAHFGTYVLSVDGDREDLAGPDVILVHRLLKNTVGDAGGPQAYVFLTDPCLQRLPPSFDLPPHSEILRVVRPDDGWRARPQAGRRTDARSPSRLRRHGGCRRGAQLRRASAPTGRASGSTSSIPRSGCAGSRCRPRSRTSPTSTEGSGPEHRAIAPTGCQATRCASTSTGARTATSPPASPPSVAGRFFFPCIETFEFTPTDAGTLVHYRFRLEECGPLTRLRFLGSSSRRSEDADPVRKSAGQDPRRGQSAPVVTREQDQAVTGTRSRRRGRRQRHRGGTAVREPVDEF